MSSPTPADPPPDVAPPALMAPPAPATPRGPRLSPAHLTARVGALIGALLAAVGTVLPWMTMPDPFDASVRVASAGVESRQGIAALVAGVVVAVLVTMGGRARLLWAVVPATVVVLVASGTLVDCLRPEPELGGLLGALLTGPDAASGLWTTLVGGVVALACAPLAGRTAPATQPPTSTS